MTLTIPTNNRQKSRSVETDKALKGLGNKKPAGESKRRLGVALRENLKKRKIQLRTRKQKESKNIKDSY